MILIIDAYNILKNIFHNVLISEKQRRAFIDLITKYAHTKKHTIYIVFDGNSSDVNQSHNHSVSIIYSGYNKSADQVIISLVEKLPEKDNILLISSDNNLKKTARTHAVASCDSVEFYKYITQDVTHKQLQKNKSPHTHKYTHHASSTELDELMHTSIVVHKDETPIAKPTKNAYTASKEERKLNKIIKKL
ncbi:MAG: NYN domain-containing protein [Candidatus Babeliaceae bacterium]